MARRKPKQKRVPKKFMTLNAHIKILREKKKKLLSLGNSIPDSSSKIEKDKKNMYLRKGNNIISNSFDFFYNYLNIVIKKQRIKNVSIKKFNNSNLIELYYRDIKLLNILVSKTDSLSITVSEDLINLDKEYYKHFNNPYYGLFLGMRNTSSVTNLMFGNINYFIHFQSIKFTCISEKTIYDTIKYYICHVYKFFNKSVFVKKVKNVRKHDNPYHFFVRRVSKRYVYAFDFLQKTNYLIKSTSSRGFNFDYITYSPGRFMSSFKERIPRLKSLNKLDFKIVKGGD